MDTVPHYAQKGNLNPFYVYTLAYPDGRIFYVGKGQTYQNGIDRVDNHEREALHDRSTDCNLRKIAAIKRIWADGGEVVKSKVAHFADETEAFMYEWALINMTCYSLRLTNITRAPGWPSPHAKFEYPQLDKPICISRGVGLRRTIHHRISDLEAFRAQSRLNANKLLDLVNGKIDSYGTWRIVSGCTCFRHCL